jgi:hypothetical protein
MFKLRALYRKKNIVAIDEIFAEFFKICTRLKEQPIMNILSGVILTGQPYGEDK